MKYRVTLNEVTTKQYLFYVDANSEDEAQDIVEQELEPQDGELYEDYDECSVDVEEVTDSEEK